MAKLNKVTQGPVQRSGFWQIFWGFTCTSMLLLFIFLFLACNKAETLSSLSLPPTPVISSKDAYALLIDPYISFRDIPGSEGITKTHGRRGDVYRIVSKRFIGTGTSSVLWVELEPGWISSSSILLYSSFRRAQRASKILD